MGASSSSAGGRSVDAGEIVTVSADRGASSESQTGEASDPIMQRLAQLRSVTPILPAGQVTFGEQLAAELSAGGPCGASSAASLVHSLRGWTHERSQALTSSQEELDGRIVRTEQQAEEVLRRASRSGAVARMLAADMKHARQLQTELATVGAQLCGVLESYSNLLRTFEVAAAWRTSSSTSSAGSLTGSPRVSSRSSQPALPLSPLRLAAGGAARGDSGASLPHLALDGQHMQAPVAVASSGAGSLLPGWAYEGLDSPRLARPSAAASPPRFSLSASDAVSAVGHVRLPPLRTAVQPLPPVAAPSAPGSPAGGAAPTPQSKRALFGAVAEAAALGAGISGVRTTPAVAASPLSRLRPESDSPRAFVLEPRSGSPGHVHLSPLGGVSGRAGSPSMLRLDPYRHSGADAFTPSPPPVAAPPPLSLTPLMPSPRSPLRGMGNGGRRSVAGPSTLASPAEREAAAGRFRDTAEEARL